MLWLLTVMQDTSGGVVQRGMFAGWGCHRESGGVAFREAAALSASVNIVEVESRFDRLACWLDPAELRTTWLGNKAVYRTRMAMADGGELLVLAPGVRRFSEDAAIDALIRRHGYRGTPATIEAVGQDPDLAANLGAAAHLIHGSSEGRFRIVYCTDPSTGGASRDEIEGVGYGWRSLPDVLNDLGVTGETPDGRYRDRRGEPFNFLQNPALGLWRAV